ncbi:(deoxy)nucleoside triphosphate pyrophosphohydrolase [Buchnera aphidicola (Hyperomyzus lactucae)]|uniref:8-oxo-dGTP diphosphatase n=1 Tax=Buchnera aphidicola (Hyperomyzus lactucae) TaxID=1241860 RepID=A0A4D6Y9F4_9GAMM|nr:(deoxy)nucleoside triphosphate pyrophosphohydrolase [Buchnera aphidicola]QCI20935.1 (deoxy)nucleoside triphosphate pyrophosphohydrolase [Buchnera aphidicola (Hyperomyzus lactucae)]
MNYKAAIGILIKKNEVYITRGKYKTNTWEFPGGKVKKNETIVEALKRELLEEVGIIVLKCIFFKYVEHIDCNKKIKLYFFLIKKWKGRPYSKEGYFYVWKFLYDLKSSDFPSANLNIINDLKKISLKM